MLKEIIKKISSFLPLTIEHIEWNDPTLILRGKNWCFTTVSSWRIIENNKLICGCYDAAANDEINKLKNVKITSIANQSQHIFSDPVFTFSEEKKLEIFSTTFLEPWIFDFGSGIVYVNSPS